MSRPIKFLGLKKQLNLFFFFFFLNQDSKTGESLQYAFIEFGNEEDCEKAYFKMDNVLIDDRRIHVDFSQSVSKLKWKGKGLIENFLTFTPGVKPSVYRDYIS